MERRLTTDEKVEIALMEIDQKMQARYQRPLQSHERSAVAHRMKTDLLEDRHKEIPDIVQGIWEKIYNALGPAISESTDEPAVDVNNPKYVTMQFSKLPHDVQEHLLTRGDTLFTPGSKQRLQIYEIRVKRQLSMMHPKDTKD